MSGYMKVVEVNSKRWFSLENLESEEWRAIQNSNYSISTYGRLRRDKHSSPLKRPDGTRILHYKERIMRLTLSKLGYYHTRIKIGDSLVDVRVNRLVAEAFIPNPDNLPYVNHKNENTKDNRVCNLEFCTAKYNANYGTAKERMKKTRKERGIHKWHSIKQYDKEGRLINTFACKSELEDAGYNYYSVARVCAKITPTHRDFIWRYDDDPFSYEVKKRAQGDIDDSGHFVPRPVVQYSADGEYIREFASMKEAAEAMNGKRTSISYACKGRTPRAYGYIWIYKGDPAPKPFKHKVKRSVIQYTQDMEYVAEYPTLKEAAAALTGDTKKWTSIWDCCNGELKTYKGFIWRYKEDNGRKYKNTAKR